MWGLRRRTKKETNGSVMIDLVPFLLVGIKPDSQTNYFVYIAILALK